MTDGVDGEIRIDLARLEGKVDAALTGHGGRLGNLEMRSSDHEDRLRKIEARPVVSPRHIYVGVTLACLLLGAVVSVLTLFK